MSHDIKKEMRDRIGKKYASGKTGASKGAKESDNDGDEGMGMHPGKILANALAENDHHAIVAAVKACNSHGE